MATLYENYTTGDDNYEPAFSTTWDGQTFTAGTAHTITSVKLLIYRKGSPGQVTVSIRATASGLPTGSDLVSGTADGNAAASASPYTWQEFTFGAGTSLAAGSTYGICLRCAGADTANEIKWRDDATSPTYAGGSFVGSSNAGSTWTAATAEELLFEDWGTAGTTVTVPVASLATTTYAPTLKTAAIPGVKALSTTAYSPTLKTAVIPGVKALALTTYVPTVATPVVVTVPVKALNLTSYAPTPTSTENQTVTVPVKTLAVTAYAPTLVRPVTVTPPTAALLTTAYGPVLTVTITPGVFALTLTTYAPTATVTVAETHFGPYAMKNRVTTSHRVLSNRRFGRRVHA